MANEYYNVMPTKEFEAQLRQLPDRMDAGL